MPRDRPPEQPQNAALAHHLAGIVGDRHVVSDRELLANYETDWTGRWHGRASLAVRPLDATQAAAVLAACASAGERVVVQGGNTGLVGGAVPTDGSVVVSTARMVSLDTMRIDDGVVTAGAGVTLAELQRAAARAGWRFGVDLAARDSATIGGMVATNAGGVHVVRSGMMRAQVVGIEMALTTGEIVRELRGLDKDNVGADLAQLACGSEGTLGVVTRVQVRLHRPHGATTLLLIPARDVGEAVTLATRARRSLGGVVALEYVDQQARALVVRHHAADDPLAGHDGGVLLVESEDPLEVTIAALGLTGRAADRVRVATDDAARRQLWALRERVPEAINQEGVPRKLDVSLPLAELGGFERWLHARITDVTATPVVIGHVGDGNLHVNLVAAPDGDERAMDRLESDVYREAVRRGGSISAEHGIGRAKAHLLQLVRSPDELAVLERIGRAMDPTGTLARERNH
jgi:FAD/FMN-containing dehydrogenase